MFGGGWQLLALNQFNQGICRQIQTLVKLALFKRGRHLLTDNTLGNGIGDRAFQPITHFDAHFPVVFSDDNNDAIILFVTANFPGVGQPDTKLCDFFWLSSRQQQYGHLRASLLRKLAELLVERGLLLGRQGLRQIRHRSLQWRNIDQAIGCLAGCNAKQQAPGKQ